jgi:general secretion pathway protein A
MYLEYYKLTHKPFEISTDPAFLWPGERYREALAALQYGVLENRGFLVLTGEVGVGKTTLVNALLQDLGSEDLVAVVHDPVLESLDFFNYVARSFDLPGGYSTKGEFLVAFSAFLLKAYYQNRRVLLIIDECQLISPSFLTEIRLFSNFEKKGNKLINVFFVGQPEFNDMLLLPDNKAVRQRINVNYNIPPLAPEETAEYIQYRLSVAGCRKSMFKKGAVKEIHRFSSGYPRLVNMIADRALLTGYVRSRRRINRRIVRECAKELDISQARSDKEAST